MGEKAVEDRVYLAYDDKYLYVGYHNPAPKQIRGNPPMVAAMMKVSKTAFDTNVDADDSFFIRMRDPYPFGDDRLIVNHGNTHYDYTVGGKNSRESTSTGIRRGSRSPPWTWMAGTWGALFRWTVSSRCRRPRRATCGT